MINRVLIISVLFFTSCYTMSPEDKMIWYDYDNYYVLDTNGNLMKYNKGFKPDTLVSTQDFTRKSIREYINPIPF